MEFKDIRFESEHRTHRHVGSDRAFDRDATGVRSNISAGGDVPKSATEGSEPATGGRSRRSRPLRRKSRRRYEKLRQDPLAQALVMRLARTHRISLSDLMQAGRGSGTASHTRQIAMYLCHVLLRRTQEQLGELFNRDRKTVSHACTQIELQREGDCVLDRELILFETEGWMEAARRELELVRDAA